MVKNHFVSTIFILLSFAGFSQTTPRDTVPVSSQENLDIDTSFDYDELLNEMDIFLDSLLSPRSYFLASVSAGSGYFNYSTRNNTKIESIKKGVYTPTMGYYHKSGPGLTLSGNITDENIKRKNLINLKSLKLRKCLISNDSVTSRFIFRSKIQG